MLTEHQTSNNLSNQVCLMTEGHLASWCIQRSHLWRTYCESNMEMRKDGGGGMSAPSGASSVPAQSSCYKSALIVLLLLVTGLFVGLLIGESMCFVIKLNCTWTCKYEFDSSKKKKKKKGSLPPPLLCCYQPTWCRRSIVSWRQCNSRACNMILFYRRRTLVTP